MAKKKQEMVMTCELIDKLRHDAKEALNKVFKPHGVIVQGTGGTYGPGAFGSIKIEVSVGNASRAEEDFKLYAGELSLKASDLGRSFFSDLYCGKEMRYTIIGMNPRSRSKPLICRTETGDKIVYPADFDFGKTVSWCDDASRPKASVREEFLRQKKKDAQFNFHFYSHTLGLKNADLGRSFILNGERYTITGMIPKKKKYPLVCDNKDGKSMLIPADSTFGSTVKWCDEERKAS